MPRLPQFLPYIRPCVKFSTNKSFKLLLISLPKHVKNITNGKKQTTYFPLLSLRIENLTISNIYLSHLLKNGENT